MTNEPEPQPNPFAGDDAAYLQWLDEMQDGYVLNLRQSGRSDANLAVHHQSCDDIRTLKGTAKPGGFTERTYMKVWRANLAELKTWAENNRNLKKPFAEYECGHCKPFSEHLHAVTLLDGARRSVVLNGYERNPKLRDLCLKYYGSANCQICGMSFASEFGEQFSGYIHVHHIKPLSEMGESHPVDPRLDLIPVCPNCHAVLHSREPAFHPDEIRGFRSIAGLLRAQDNHNTAPAPAI